MKIENIIEDIKNDMTELANKLQEQLKKENPGLDFTVSLPGIEELTTIKSMVLTMEESNVHYNFSVQIHTHNGSRVFENPARAVIGQQAVPCTVRHPFQDKFVNLLREIIKKNKGKVKPGGKSGDLFNDLHQYM